MKTAYTWLTEYLALAGSVQIGENWQCPAHDDSFPSLSITEDPESGKAILYCHAGCTYLEVCEGLRQSPSILFDAHPWSPEKVLSKCVEPPVFADFKWKSGSGGRAETSYELASRYAGSGTLQTRVVQYHQYTNTVRLNRTRDNAGNKYPSWEILQDGKWRTSKQEVSIKELPLYRVVLLRANIESGYPVILCESESSVDALVSLGHGATTWAGGAGTPPIDLLIETLRDARVLWIPDNDPAGLKCDKKLQELVAPHVVSWKRLIGDEGEDARDLVERGVIDTFNLDEIMASAPELGDKVTR